MEENEIIDCDDNNHNQTQHDRMRLNSDKCDYKTIQKNVTSLNTRR